MTAQLDPERRLALAYVPAAKRPALDALWRLDVTLGAVLATGSDPMVGRIRLAWWRESLERLDRAPPPAEPVLEGLARHVLPGGLSGAELEPMVEGWEELLEPGTLTMVALRRYADQRGGLLFRLGGRVLGNPAHPVEAAGARWALVDLARRSGRVEEAQAAIGLAAKIAVEDLRWPLALRPLGMLAMLAKRDVGRGVPERQGGPARMLRMIRHRLTGR